MDLSNLTDAQLNALIASKSDGLTKRQIQVESGGRSGAVSPKGARGLMQVMPRTGVDPGFGVAPLRDDSDAENIRFGIDYRNAMKKRYNGDDRLALAAYNAGPGVVDDYLAGKRSLPSETVDYIAKHESALSKDDNPIYALSDSDLDSLIASKTPAPQEQPPPVTRQDIQAQFDRRKAGFIDRVKDDWRENLEGRAMQENARQQSEGLISPAEANLRAGLKTAKIVPDVAGEAFVSGFRALPDSIENPIRKGAGNLYSAIEDTAAGDLARSAVQKYDDFAEKHPVAASRIGSGLDAGNLLAAALPVKSANVSASAVKTVPKVVREGNRISGEGASILKGAATYPGTRLTQKAISENLDDYGLDLALKARKMGIKVPVDSIVKDGPLKTLGQVSQGIPFSGVKKIDKENLSIWSNAVAKTIGSDTPINAKVLGEAKERFGKQFDAIETGRKFDVSEDFLKGINDFKVLANEASTTDVGNVLRKQISKIEDNLKLYPELPLSRGNMKKQLDIETLASLRKDFGKLSSKASNYDISSSLGDLQGFISDQIVDSLPSSGRAEYQSLKNQYRNYLAIKKAVKLDPESALNSPARLLSSVATVYKDFPTGGGGELGDLARIGKAFVSPRSIGSNTAEKLLTYGGATGAAVSSFLNPVGTSLAAGGILTSGRLGKNIIYNQKAIDRAIAKQTTRDDLQLLFNNRKGLTQ